MSYEKPKQPNTYLFDGKSDEQDSQSIAIRTTIFAIVVAFLGRFYFNSVFQAYKSPLSKIPGRWYACWTTIHLRYSFARGTIWRYVEQCHRKYGDVVRLGPRQIWVADKAALKDILQGTDLPKVTMYAEISRDRSSPGLFGEIRPIPHKNLKRFLGPAFTVPSVDRLDSFFKSWTSNLLEAYYLESKRCGDGDKKGVVKTDLMRDLHCLALDITGESSFDNGFGQLDKVFDPSKKISKKDEE